MGFLDTLKETLSPSPQVMVEPSVTSPDDFISQVAQELGSPRDFIYKEGHVTEEGKGALAQYYNEHEKTGKAISPLIESFMKEQKLNPDELYDRGVCAVYQFSGTGAQQSFRAITQCNGFFPSAFPLPKSAAPLVKESPVSESEKEEAPQQEEAAGVIHLPPLNGYQYQGGIDEVTVEDARRMKVEDQYPYLWDTQKKFRETSPHTGNCVNLNYEMGKKLSEKIKDPNHQQIYFVVGGFDSKGTLGAHAWLVKREKIGKVWKESILDYANPQSPREIPSTALAARRYVEGERKPIDEVIFAVDQQITLHEKEIPSSESKSEIVVLKGIVKGDSLSKILQKELGLSRAESVRLALKEAPKAGLEIVMSMRGDIFGHGAAQGIRKVVLPEGKLIEINYTTDIHGKKILSGIRVTNAEGESDENREETQPPVIRVDPVLISADDSDAAQALPVYPPLTVGDILDEMWERDKKEKIEPILNSMMDGVKTLFSDS